MDKIHAFSTGKYCSWPSRQQVDESMPENFKGAYQSARCIIDCTNTYIKDSRSSPFNSNFPLIKLKLQYYI